MVIVSNYFAVIIAAVASMIAGMLWYSPFLFGNLWLKLSGWDKKRMHSHKSKGMTAHYLLAFVCALITACVLGQFVSFLAITQLITGLQVVFLLWLGFIATVLMGSVLWEGKSWGAYFITSIYYLVNLSIMVSILILWN